MSIIFLPSSQQGPDDQVLEMKKLISSLHFQSIFHDGVKNIASGLKSRDLTLSADTTANSLYYVGVSNHFISKIKIIDTLSQEE